MAVLNEGAELMLQAMGGQAIAAASKFLSLYVGQPSVGGVEVSAAGYNRLDAQTTVADNVLSVSIGEWDDSADVSWGTPTWVGYHTAQTGGVLLFEGAINPALSPIAAGARVFTDAGDIQLTIPLA